MSSEPLQLIGLETSQKSTAKKKFAPKPKSKKPVPSVGTNESPSVLENTDLLDGNGTSHTVSVDTQSAQTGKLDDLEVPLMSLDTKRDYTTSSVTMSGAKVHSPRLSSTKGGAKKSVSIQLPGEDKAEQNAKKKLARTDIKSKVKPKRDRKKRSTYDDDDDDDDDDDESEERDEDKSEAGTTVANTVIGDEDSKAGILGEYGQKMDLEEEEPEFEKMTMLPGETFLTRAYTNKNKEELQSVFNVTNVTNSFYNEEQGTKKARALHALRSLLYQCTDVAKGKEISLGLRSMLNHTEEDINLSLTIMVDRDSRNKDKRPSTRTLMEGNDVKSYRKQRTLVKRLGKVQKTLVLPFGFGAKTRYTVHNVFLKKSPRGVGLRVRIIDNRLVIRDFAEWFDPYLNLRVNDVIMNINHLDCRESNPYSMLAQLVYKAPARGEKTMVGLSIVEDLVSITIARPDIYEIDETIDEHTKFYESTGTLSNDNLLPLKAVDYKIKAPILEHPELNDSDDDGNGSNVRIISNPGVAANSPKKRARKGKVGGNSKTNTTDKKRKTKFHGDVKPNPLDSATSSDFSDDSNTETNKRKKAPTKKAARGNGHSNTSRKIILDVVPGTHKKGRK